MAISFALQQAFVGVNYSSWKSSWFLPIFLFGYLFFASLD